MDGWIDGWMDKWGLVWRVHLALLAVVVCAFRCSALQDTEYVELRYPVVFATAGSPFFVLFGYVGSPFGRLTRFLFLPLRGLIGSVAGMNKMYTYHSGAWQART